MGEAKAATETRTGFERWSYQDHFREYLLLLANKGEQGLESINSFPKRIQLGKVWHQALKEMRQSSGSSVEKFALIGFKDDRRRIFLQTAPAKGTSVNVPSEVIEKQIQAATQKFGMAGLLGDLHSHPRGWFYGFFGEGGISAGDFYRMVAGERDRRVYPEFLPIMGVADGGENIFAFKTRETTPLGVPRELLSQTSFKNYWYERCGFDFSVDPGEERVSEPVTFNPSIRKMNLAIAKRHNLALYRGRPGRDLIRVYPK